MHSRLVSLLLVVWLMMSGLSTPAQGAVTAEHGPAVEALMGAAHDTDHGPLAPVLPEAPDERDGMIDLPELFDPLNGPGRGGVAASGPGVPPLASPAKPYLEGLRRPPRSARLG